MRYGAIRCLCVLLTMATLAVVAGCDDEEQFTLNQNAALEFEMDTVRFDTVLTRTDSPTKRFKVYNRNKEGIRIAAVRLMSNGASGFRINVDGHSGTVLTDVEVLANDSLFLFAEITPNLQGTQLPVLLTDTIQFELESGRRQQIILEAFGQDVRIIHGETFTADTTLTAELPYLIFDSIMVAPGTTLTIEPGTTLYFHNDAWMGVRGTCVCNGTLEENIVFRGDRTDRIFPYLPYDRLQSQWGGIVLFKESHENSFTYVDIHSGNYGIVCEPTDSLDQQIKFTLHNSMIHNVSGYGLFMCDCNGIVTNSQISNAGSDCVCVVGGTCEITHSTIAQCYPWSSDHGYALRFANMDDEEKPHPLLQLTVTNSIVTGNGADEIAGSKAENDDVAFNVSFRNCLINIETSDDDPDFVKQMFVDCTNEWTLIKDYRDWLKQHPNSKEKEQPVFGARNFRTVDYDNFVFDFRLDSLSNARGIGQAEAVSLLPKDREGIERPNDKPDAGCYQFASN